MSCAFDQEKLSAYFDGELDPAEKGEVERHIAGCSECLRELGELKGAVKLVQTLPAVRAPRSLAAGVSRGIAAPAAGGALHAWRPRVLWATAAAAGLFVVLNLAYFAKVQAPGDEPVVAAARPAASAPKIAVVHGPADAERKNLASNASAPPGRDEDDKARRSLDRAPAPGADALVLREKAAQPDAAKDGRAESLKKAGEDPQAGARPAPRPDAPATPPAAAAVPKPAAAPLAPVEEKREQLLVQKNQADEKQAAAQTVFLACGQNPNIAQTVVEGWTRQNLQSRGAAQARAGQSVASGAGGVKSAKSFGKEALEPPGPMVIEVTDDELALLTKSLEAQGYKVTPASLAQNKLGYVDVPPPAVATGSAAPKGKLAAAAETERRKEPESAEKADAPVAKAPAEGGAGAPVNRQRSALRRITLYFVEEPAAAPPAKSQK